MRILIVILLNGFILQAQNLLEGQKLWDADHPLTVNDYSVAINDANNEPIYGQFTIQTNPIRGFELLKRNFNKKVETVFIGSASWINHANVENFDKQIEFQQIQFDIAELHARKVRKNLLLNKTKLLTNSYLLKELLNNAMTRFSEMLAAFIKETKKGSDEKILLEWKNKIEGELTKLKEFDYKNTKGIKAKKYEMD